MPGKSSPKLHFKDHLQASKNVAEYEALIVGRKLTKKIQVKQIYINIDSPLIVN